jgi:hypothetical protein
VAVKDRNEVELGAARLPPVFAEGAPKKLKKNFWLKEIWL